MEITKDTKILDLFNAYPALKEHLPTINENFAILSSPIAEFMLSKATIGIACERTGMSEEALIGAIKLFIDGKDE